MKIVQLSNRLKIIEMVYRANESHLGSALSIVDIIEAIYQTKKMNDRFVLSAGHAVPALYAVLATHGLLKNPDLKILGNHPERNPQNRIDVSSGSLGQGLPIAVGMALADRTKKVYCCSSDGECAEGSIYEALRIVVDNNLTNITIVVNANGYGAYKIIKTEPLSKIFKGLGLQVVSVDGHNLNSLKRALSSDYKEPTIIIAKTRVDQLPFLHGISAHYYKMSEADCQLAVKKWSKN